MKFLGREHELEILNSHWGKKTSSLIVIRGRRRIGKSTLVEKFSETADHYYKFEGLAPADNIKRISQIEHINHLLQRKYKFKKKLETWLDIFKFINSKINKKRTVLFLDEISWMGMDDPDFPGYLKIAWDNLFSKHDKLIVVLAGSVSAWIEKNILMHTAFVGRISSTMTLPQLSLEDAKDFFNEDKNLSTYDKLKFLSITGGVPKYINEYKFNKTTNQNIHQLCFDANGLLFTEFDRIFKDIFTRRSDIYKKITESLIQKPLTLSEICSTIKVRKNGNYKNYLNDLVVAGFIHKADQFDILTGQAQKMAHFRLSDNYLRFNLKYIDRFKKQIQNGHFKNKTVESLLGFDQFIGYQFENLIFNNLDCILNLLDIDANSVVSAGPYSQKKNTRNKNGVQIDLLVHCKPNILYVCEIKFKKKIGDEIAQQIHQKVKKLKYPKYMTVKPVLIYAGDASQKVLEQTEIQLISAEDLI
jgi:hypothetical protein